MAYHEHARAMETMQSHHRSRAHMNMYDLPLLTQVNAWTDNNQIMLFVDNLIADKLERKIMSNPCACQ